MAHVLIFENRGAMVGTSNPHPHCQIYAGAMVYATMDREAEVACEHHRRTGRPLLAEVIERELEGPRVISEGEHFFACVPWFAQYAYEVHVLPRQPVTSLVDLDEDQCRSLALVLRDVVRRYDALWGFRLPYVLAVHQAPVGDHPHYPFHLELHPPLRAPGLPQVPGRPRGGWRLHDQRVRPRPEGGGASCRPRLRKPVVSCARSATTCATSSWAPRGMDMAAVAGETVADTIYAIDRVADDALIDWFEEHWPDVVVVSEGLDEPVRRREAPRHGRSSSTPSTARGA